MKDDRLQQMNDLVIEKLKMGLLKQKIAWTTFYQVRSGSIAASGTTPATINIAGDSDFIGEKLFIVIDGLFSDDLFTVTMNMIDAGSGRRITRQALDLRAIANPGNFAPGSANAGNAHYVTGIDFKFLFRKNSNIQFEFSNTDTVTAHAVSIVMQGKAIDNWDRIPNDLG